MKHLRYQTKINVLIHSIFYLLPLISYAGDYGGGSGTTDDPYLIYTDGQLNTIGLNQEDWGKHFKLMADIDLQASANSSFHLIGNHERPFQGVFDGNGHAISNFSYAVAGYEHEVLEGSVKGFGLFRYLAGARAVIKNLRLVNPDLHPAETFLVRLWNVGALVGTIESGSLINCHVEGGQVGGETNVGGLVGSNSGIISDCTSSCNVRALEERSLRDVYRGLMNYAGIGGLVGRNRGEISHCHASATVSGETEIGGLVGEAMGIISYSGSSGDVSGENTVGGLVGWLHDPAQLSHCHAEGHVSGQWSIGGLVGANGRKARIDNCFVFGTVSAEKTAGGLVGRNSGAISGCYSRAAVSASADRPSVGGLVGHNAGTIATSWACGTVTGENGIGGLVGLNYWRGAPTQGFFFYYDAVVSDSYARSIVRGGDGDSVGGLIGQNKGGTVLRCYATGTVTGAEGRIVGGLIGRNTEMSTGPIDEMLRMGIDETLIGLTVETYIGKIEGSFWDTVTSGLSESNGGVGKTTDQMFDLHTYQEAGWDLATEAVNGRDGVWKVCGDTPMYARLAWEELYCGDLSEEFLAMDLQHDPGWETEGQWQFGRPTGAGGAEQGYSDPSSGYTGDNVYGVNLNGDYSIDNHKAHYLTAGPFDCSQYREIKLQFASWLNTDRAGLVRTTLEMSTDGEVWQTLWAYADQDHTLEADDWQVMQYDISPMADLQTQVYLRWGYQVMQDDAWAMSGWNIDDVKLIGAKWYSELLPN